MISSTNQSPDASILPDNTPCSLELGNVGNGLSSQALKLTVWGGENLYQCW